MCNTSSRIAPGKRSLVDQSHHGGGSHTHQNDAANHDDAGATPGKRTLTEALTERGVVGRMERAFGMSFRDVAMRDDRDAAARAEALGVEAYARRDEIGLDPRRVDLETAGGMQILAHEFAHVAQARGGTPGAARVTPPGDREGEANHAAQAVLRGEPVSVGATGDDIAGHDPDAKLKEITLGPGQAYVLPFDGKGIEILLQPSDAASAPPEVLAVGVYFLRRGVPRDVLTTLGGGYTITLDHAAVVKKQISSGTAVSILIPTAVQSKLDQLIADWESQHGRTLSLHDATEGVVTLHAGRDKAPPPPDEPRRDAPRESTPNEKSKPTPLDKNVKVPDIRLFDPVSKLLTWNSRTADIPLLDVEIPVPVVGPVGIHANAKLAADACAEATAGPGAVRDVILGRTGDPTLGTAMGDVGSAIWSGEYKARGKLDVPVSLSARFGLHGEVTGKLKHELSGLAAGITGSIEATGHAKQECEISSAIQFTYRDGKAVLSAAPSFRMLLRLAFDLDAAVVVNLHFSGISRLIAGRKVVELWSRRWKLQQWRSEQLCTHARGKLDIDDTGDSAVAAIGDGSVDEISLPALAKTLLSANKPEDDAVSKELAADGSKHDTQAHEAGGDDVEAGKADDDDEVVKQLRAAEKAVREADRQLGERRTAGKRHNPKELRALEQRFVDVRGRLDSAQALVGDDQGHADLRYEAPAIEKEALDIAAGVKTLVGDDAAFAALTEEIAEGANGRDYEKVAAKLGGENSWRLEETRKIRKVIVAKPARAPAFQPYLDLLETYRLALEHEAAPIDAFRRTWDLVKDHLDTISLDRLAEVDRQLAAAQAAAAEVDRLLADRPKRPKGAVLNEWNALPIPPDGFEGEFADWPKWPTWSEIAKHPANEKYNSFNGEIPVPVDHYQYTGTEETEGNVHTDKWHSFLRLERDRRVAAIGKPAPDPAAPGDEAAFLHTVEDGMVADVRTGMLPGVGAYPDIENWDSLWLNGWEEHHIHPASWGGGELRAGAKSNLVYIEAKHHRIEVTPKWNTLTAEIVRKMRDSGDL